jgi:hypothetical protein
MDVGELDSHLGSIRSRVIKGARDTRQRRFLGCLRSLGIGPGPEAATSAEVPMGAPAEESALTDAINRFRLAEANIPAPATGHKIPGGTQIDSKSRFGKPESPAGDPPAEPEAEKDAGGKDSAGREQVDVRVEDQDLDMGVGIANHFSDEADDDLDFAAKLMAGKDAFQERLDSVLNESEAGPPSAPKTVTDDEALAAAERGTDPQTEQIEQPDPVLKANAEVMKALGF